MWTIIDSSVMFSGSSGMLADALRDQIRAVRARTSFLFGVNVFVPGLQEVDEAAVERYLERLRPEAERYGVELGEPHFDDDDWQGKLSILHEEPVPVVSFTFGCPSPETIDGLRRRASEIWVTVTDVAEARAARDAGADVLVLQGFEAGGH